MTETSERINNLPCFDPSLIVLDNTVHILDLSEQMPGRAFTVRSQC